MSYHETAMLITMLFIAVCFLAYANGANDNFKGVASLYGSGTCGYRKALAWAAVTTLAGSVTALFVAQSLLAKFSGKGWCPRASWRRRIFCWPSRSALVGPCCLPRGSAFPSRPRTASPERLSPRAGQ